MLKLSGCVTLDLVFLSIREAVVRRIRLEEPVAQAEHTVVALEKLVV